MYIDFLVVKDVALFLRWFCQDLSDRYWLYSVKREWKR